MPRLAGVVAGGWIVLALGCAGSVSSKVGGGPEAGAGAGAGAGADVAAGGAALPAATPIIPSGVQPAASDCATDADCPQSTTSIENCTPVVAGGNYICIHADPPVTGPSSDRPHDECDGTRSCATGTCYSVSTSIPRGICGNGGGETINACRSDTCSSDADCPDGVCGPRGLTLGEFEQGGAIRQCLKAACSTDADCTQEPGGACALVAGGCEPAHVGREFIPAQLACVYANGCRRDSDCDAACAAISRPCECLVVDGAAVCVQVSPSP